MKTSQDHAPKMSGEAGQAGTVNIYFFLVVVCLFLGVSTYAYHLFVTTNEQEKQTDEINDLNTRKDGWIRLEKDYHEALKNSTGLVGEYTGREGIKPERYGNAKIASCVSPSVLRDRIAQLSAELSIPAATTLPGMFENATPEFEALAAIEASAAQNAEIAVSMQQAAEGAESGFSSNAAAEQSELDEVKNNDSAEFSSVDTERQTTVASLGVAGDSAGTELKAAASERKDEVRDLTEKGNRLHGANTAMVERLRIAPSYEGPDGRVISTLNGVNRVYISLGKKDNLVPGVVFRITEAGKSDVKAIGRVASVDQDRAAMDILSLADANNPVVRNDQLHSSIYSPNVRRNIYLMGRFGYPYDRKRIEEQMAGLGNRVFSEFQPGIDLVILGQDVFNEDRSGFVRVEDTEEYKNALSLGVQFMKLTDVRDLLGAIQ